MITLAEYADYDYETLVDIYEHINEREYPDRKAAVAAQLQVLRDQFSTLDESRMQRDQNRYHTLTLRLAAHFIDCAVIFVFSLFVVYLTSLLSPAVAKVIVFLMQYLVLAYFAFFHSRGGQTLGKYCLSIRVVRSADDKAISLKQSWGREAINFVIVISIHVTFFVTLMMSGSGAEVLSYDYTHYHFLAVKVVFYLGFLGLLISLFDHKKRSFSDVLAGTVIVNELSPHES